MQLKRRVNGYLYALRGLLTSVLWKEVQSPSKPTQINMHIIIHLYLKGAVSDRGPKLIGSKQSIFKKIKKFFLQKQTTE